MSAIVLISGKLFRDPQRKTSRSDRPYAMATVRVGNDKDSSFWQVMAFGDVEVEDLMMLRSGDAVSVSGSMKAEIYLPEGKPARVSLSMFADRVISNHRVRQDRPRNIESKSKEPTEQRPFDDSMPF